MRSTTTGFRTLGGVWRVAATGEPGGAVKRTATSNDGGRFRASLAKCQARTDCRTGLRNSSGPLTTLASVTSPWLFTVTASTTSPATPFWRASPG